MLGAFCAPFTFFEEASDYLADTESELVHYYLTPLPDNGEACVEPPHLDFASRATLAPLVRDYPAFIVFLIRFFFHPPE